MCFTKLKLGHLSRCTTHQILCITIHWEWNDFTDVLLGYGRKKGDAKEAVIKDITFQDIRVTAKEKNDIREEPSRPFRNIIFDDAATR